VRRLEWHPVAIHDLREIHWRAGARIDAAVMRFAETGEGTIERSPTDPRRIRLRVRGAVALIFVAHDAIHVARIFGS